MRFNPLAAVLILFLATLGGVATSVADELAPLSADWLTDLPSVGATSLAQLESIALSDNPTLRQAEMRRASCG